MRPKQEQELIERFATAAPGLPLARCGNGVMKECVNMDIEPDRLVPRKQMGRLYKNTSFDPDAEFLFSTAEADSYGQAQKERHFFLAKISSGSYRLWGIKTTGVAGFNLTHAPAEIKQPSGESLDIAGDAFAMQKLSEFSYLLSCRRYLFSYASNSILNTGMSFASYVVDTQSDTIRAVGVPRPEIVNANINPAAAGYQYVGAEYAIKKNGIVIRSSGITCPSEPAVMYNRTQERVYTHSRINTLDIKQLFKQNGITHLRVWISDGKATKKEAKNEFGKLYMVLEFPLDGFIASAGDSYFSSAQGEKTVGGFYYENGYIGIEIVGAVAEHRNPSGYDETPENTLADGIDAINLVPMANVVCRAGERLWGVTEETKLAYGSFGLTTSVRLEQRDPLAVLEIGLGEIKAAEEMDTDLYVFCERGVAVVPGCDPESKPRIISPIGADRIKTFAADGFGIFALMENALYFLDRGTRSFSASCGGFDLNMYLGELAKDIKNVRLWKGSMYFIAAGRLFKFHLAKGCGISEIAMSGQEGTFTPVDIAPSSYALAILYKQGESVSVWIADGLNPAAAIPLESEIDYHAMFAKSAPHGWVEHWDTSVYASLKPGMEIGTEDICDGFAYRESMSLNSSSETNIDAPWEYIIPSGRERGKRRPIGKTIGIRVFMNAEGYLAMLAGGCWISQIKLTTLTQSEVFRKNFNPNRLGTEAALANENRIALGTEG